MRDEHHLRTMNLNAHFAWALAMWGSAEIAREDGNSMLVPIGFYYSGFHSGFALLNANPRLPFNTFERMGHSRLSKLLKLQLPFQQIEGLSLLREIREALNYLAGAGAAQKLRIVRGQPYGFAIDEKRYSYEESLNLARDVSQGFMLAVLQAFQSVDKKVVSRVPARGDDTWLDEYLQEDILLGVIPRGATGLRVLQKAFSLLK